MPITTRPECAWRRTFWTLWKKAAVEAEAARQKGAARWNKTDTETSLIPAGPNGGASGDGASSACKAASLGRSRGGQTSKIHLAADRRCRPLAALILTAGQAADSPQFIPVLKKVRVRGPVGRPRPRPGTRPGALAADKAYSSASAASRDTTQVRRSAARWPAYFVAFDILQADDGTELLALPYRERRRRLEVLTVILRRVGLPPHVMIASSHHLSCSYF